MPTQRNEDLPSVADPHVTRLADFFRNHPVWSDAARWVDSRASSRVRFRHRPGETWRLVRRDGVSLLEPGDVSDPDFEFLFSPGAIERITRIDGDIGDFAVALFDCVAAEDPDQRVEIQIVASFSRLARRGYLRLLIAGGPALVAFGVRHGVRTLADLRRLVAQNRRRPPR
jgi:hypothetical protein